MVYSFYLIGGDLSKKIADAKGKPISESNILNWFTQILLAMKHVHDRKIIHRDLKCQNIFLTTSGIVKLGDFGIARVLNNTHANAKTMVGTPYYLAPELVQNKPYSFEADLWSLGVILYELCALKPPFNANSIHALALKIVKGSYAPIPACYSKDMNKLLSQLLVLDSSKRMRVRDLLSNEIT